MHDRETVGLFLLARDDGMSVREAAAFAGVSASTAAEWAAGRLPRSYTGGARGSGRIARRDDPDGRGAGMGDGIRSLYEPAEEGPLAGMTPEQVENLLLRAVLDDLKGGGSHPASMPMRSRCGLAWRLRLATGLPMSPIIRFLEIPRSTWYYHRARLGIDRLAWLRPFVREAFELCGRRGYRAVHATLRAAGVRVSEKVVRRVMREEGLSARRPRRRPYLCFVKSCFRKRAHVSFGSAHATFSGLVTRAPSDPGPSQHERLLEPVARAAELDEPPVVHDAVDDRGGELVVREDRAPLGELHVGGEHDAPPLV